MTTQKVTILIPNFKTVELTKLCLRLIRKYTDLNLATVVVIDNDSQDDSLEYLRTVRWIKLIERQSIPGESPPLSHSRALDLGLQAVTTPFVLSIHTDTLVHHPDWLSFLLKQIESDPLIGGVGSWKLEAKPAWRRLFKAVEYFFQKKYYQLIGKKDHALEGVGDNYFYLRSHCALYRTELLRKYQTGFSEGESVAGKVLHRKLVTNGYRMIFLPSETLLHYMDHINHATMVINPDLGATKKAINKGQRRLQQSLVSFNAADILQDVSLDA